MFTMKFIEFLKNLYSEPFIRKLFINLLNCIGGGFMLICTTSFLMLAFAKDKEYAKKEASELFDGIFNLVSPILFIIGKIIMFLVDVFINAYDVILIAVVFDAALYYINKK